MKKIKVELEKRLEPILPLYPFKSHFIDVHGYRYHYIEEGSGKHTIVMIHGSPAWSFMFRYLIAELSKTYRVIAVDHLGCGLSDKPQNYNYRLEDHIDNLETLLLAKNLENITLLMHEWGAAIGMGFAIRHSRRIEGLAIMNSFAFSQRRFSPWRVMPFRIPFFDDKLIREMNLLLWLVLHFGPAKPLPPLVRQGYLAPYGSYEERIGILEFVRDIPLDPENASFEVLLEVEHGLWRFRDHPVTILWGLRDKIYNRDYLRRWRENYPAASLLELPDAGHYLQEDEPDAVLAHLREFMKKIENQED